MDPRKAIAWLTDPAHPGRKRGVAAGAAVLSGLLRGLQLGVREACAAELVTGGWCTTDIAGYATWVQFGNDVVQNVLIPGADLTAVVFGIVGLAHARVKAR